MTTSEFSELAAIAAMSSPHILIVEARFYSDIADELGRGARQALDAAGATHETVTVPGAFEIPAAVAMAIEGQRHGHLTTRYDGFVALGCVIRGETTHYDYVCVESARGLQDIALCEQVPIGYGILTCETREQAWTRAAVDKKNKGRDAAEACLAMLALRRKFGLADG
ncbi:MAG: 6,7-dimethyl-8-ribityllumazine synthase [Rhodospirillaceae bacterium]|nr:6,7-dimethyl-8-ribityllumazine synthase [Rhodospirillaceae bacterium]